MQSVHSFRPSVRSDTPGQKLIVKSKCRGAEFQATPSSQNLIIPQHFDSFVVRPSRRPIDGRGQKLDIELECPGRQINDSLRMRAAVRSREPGQSKAVCLQSIWTRLSPHGQNDLLYSSLTLSIITHSRFLAMFKRCTNTVPLGRHCGW